MYEFMSKKLSTQPLRGMEDYYPSDLRETNWIIDTIRDVAELYSYEEFESPSLEPIEIFAAKSSDELVNEQSFIVEKKKGEKLILIPELTPSLARMITAKRQELKKPVRWMSVPTCYRYERPQKGRRREFKQINMDILGEDSLYADLEIFSIIVDIFSEFGATSEQFQIYYNNRRFIDSVCELILQIPTEKIPIVYKLLDKADKMEDSEYEKYVLDSFQNEFIIQGIYKLKEAKSLDELLNKFENIPDKFYESKGYKDITSFIQLLKGAEINEYCTFNSGVVRGLDYYTGIVYEVFDTGKENKRSIFGGGRYDDLLNLFSDEKITGTGFGMGVLMLSLFLKTYDLIPEEIREKDYTDTIYISSINDKVSNYALKLARIIRAEDFPCLVDYRFSNLKNQLSKANDLGVLIALIIGPKEMEQNKVTVKNMKTEEQETIEINSLIDKIYDIIDESDL
jgi:histidyl-tRNA synthetase